MKRLPGWMAILTAATLATTAISATNATATFDWSWLPPKQIGNVILEGGDGTSMKKAVIIKNAVNSAEAVGAIDKWVRTNNRYWRKRGNVFVIHKSRTYNCVEYQTREYEIMTLYFDITDALRK